MLCDNLGWGNVGWHRPGFPEIQTPVMDQLVASGVELDRFYTYQVVYPDLPPSAPAPSSWRSSTKLLGLFATTAYCSPSRSSFLSGRVPFRVNLYNAPETGVNQGLPLNMTSLAEKLSSAGYKTHHIGKWHLGFSSFKHIPIGRGFNSSLGYFHHTNDYLTEVDGVTPCQGYHKVHDLWLDNAPAVHLMGQGYEEQIFSERAVQIIEDHDVSEPLFLYYAMHLIHFANSTTAPGGLEVPQAYLDRPGISDITYGPRQHVAAMVAFMDEVVGNVTGALRRTGMWDDTLCMFSPIVWSSDNGAQAWTEAGAANPFPLRGGMESNLEGGVRAAAFANGGWLPDAVRGTKLTGLMHICDWYGTFCSLAGVPPEDPRAAAAGLPPVESFDMSGYLAGKEAVSPRTGFVLDAFDNTQHKFSVGRAIIQDQYKLLLGTQPCATWFGPGYPNASAPDPYAVILNCTEGCLFNVWEDPEERNDLASAQPDRVSEMKSSLQKHAALAYDNKP
eukprot:gene9674-1741_t